MKHPRHVEPVVPDKQGRPDLREAGGPVAQDTGERTITEAARQLVFAQQYVLHHFIGTDAAIAAGYAKKTAAQTASRLLKYANVQAEINRIVQAASDECDVTVAEIVRELKKLAFYDARRAFKADGSTVDIVDLDDQTAAAICGVEVYEEFDGKGENRVQVGRTKKIKLADKGINLERLGRYKKMFVDQKEVTLGGSLTIENIDAVLAEDQE